MKNNIVLTGVKPTGTAHLGNYLGAIKPAIDGANSSNDRTYFFIADLHALTTVKDKTELDRCIRELACTWLACGLDPKKTIFYRQSDVPEIFKLSTIIGNVTAKGLLNRAHAYKAATDENKRLGRDIDFDVNMGLYTYPVLMAADILIMDTNFVPVGQDQKQHVEMAADIAGSFNAIYGKTFVIPRERILESVAVIPGLDGRKMSKSYGNQIPLFCNELDLKKYIMKITTDSTAPEIEKPKDHLIFQLHRYFTGTEMERNIGWGDAKNRLFNVINTALGGMRDRYNYLMANYAKVDEILQNGATEARKTASATLERVEIAIGIRSK